MRNLGPGFLRLGGNSQDNTCWDRAHAPHPGRVPGGARRPEDLRALRRRGRRERLAAHRRAQPQAERSRVGAGRGHGGRRREILRGARLRARARQRAGPVRPHAVPAAGYAAGGPGAGVPGLPARVPADSVARRYPSWGRPPAAAGATPPTWRCSRTAWRRSVSSGSPSTTTRPRRAAARRVSIARLLSRELMDEVLTRRRRAWRRVAHERELPIAMAETNSASCGGMPGVSNAFASALWGLDYAFTLAVGRLRERGLPHQLPARAAAARTTRWTRT